MGRVKEILLTQYIGAIVVGLLAAQAIGRVIGLVVLPLSIYLGNRNPRVDDTLTIPAQPIPVPWDSLISGMVSTFLHLLVAWTLFRWLYLKSVPTLSATEEAQTGADSSEESS